MTLASPEYRGRGRASVIEVEVWPDCGETMLCGGSRSASSRRERGVRNAIR